MPVNRHQDFASASIVALVVKSVIEADPALAQDGISPPDPMREATVPASEKRLILQRIYDIKGAGPLLSIGRHLDPAVSPVLTVLSKTTTPDILIAKWLRLERYGHAVNRTAIQFDGNNSIACSRWSEGSAPTAAENALIAGLLFGLCGLAGARGRTLEIDGRIGDARSLSAVGGLAKDGARFRIAWRGWETSVPHDHATESVRTGERLKAVLAQDVARDWSLTQCARLLAKSARTLQRELAAEGLTFSTALRGVRVDEAARLLREEEASLAEIGYCCGYADQPHFQRDFRRALNMSPGVYRSLEHS